MGRSVSYPSGALVAFTVLAVEDRDANEHDLDVEYEWLCSDLAERAAAAFPRSPLRWLARARRPDPDAWVPSRTSGFRSTAAWLRPRSPSVMTVPIETPSGARCEVPGRSAGFARSPRVSMRCLATTTASATCRTGKPLTRSGRPRDSASVQMNDLCVHSSFERWCDGNSCAQA